MQPDAQNLARAVAEKLPTAAASGSNGSEGNDRSQGEARPVFPGPHAVAMQGSEGRRSGTYNRPWIWF